MQHDDPAQIPTPSTPETTAARTPAPAAARLGPWMLALLIPATSLAVGLISVWLVVPYLLLMAWMLLAPAGEERARGPVADPGRSEFPAALAPDPGGAGQHADASPAAAPDSGATATAPAEAPPPKGRRGRGRGRSKPQPAPERPNVTWVRVGPGKFVRVETPVEPAEGSPPPDSEGPVTQPSSAVDLAPLSPPEKGAGGEGSQADRWVSPTLQEPNEEQLSPLPTEEDRHEERQDGPSLPCAPGTTEATVVAREGGDWAPEVEAGKAIAVDTELESDLESPSDSGIGLGATVLPEPPAESVDLATDSVVVEASAPAQFVGTEPDWLAGVDQQSKPAGPLQLQVGGSLGGQERLAAGRGRSGRGIRRRGAARRRSPRGAGRVRLQVRAFAPRAPPRPAPGPHAGRRLVATGRLEGAPRRGCSDEGGLEYDRGDWRFRIVAVSVPLQAPDPSPA